MRIATYNVEWFNALFDPDGNPLDDGEWSRRHDVTRSDQLAALGIVFNAIDADAVMIIEAPDHNGSQATTKALENFARLMGLRANRALVGFENDTQQEIALLYDPAMLTARHDPVGTETGKKGSRDAPRFDGVFRIDLDIDNTEDLVTFSKPPFEVAVTTAKGTELRLIGAHLKSKAPHGARSRDEIMRKAIANRRKQQAQAVWLRQRIEAHLEVDEHLIVLGDMNDGPGLDEYERLFGRSGVEIVIGEEDETRLYDPHAEIMLRRRMGGVAPTTARFWIKDRWMQALLDYVMVSPDLREKAGRWCIWHPFDEPICANTPELREALLTASDHFPVSVDLDI